MDNGSISVSQLNGYIKNTLGAEDFFHNLSVFGEVSGFKFSGPHAYFTLKDADAAIACSCFNARKTYSPSKEGESVLVKGYIDYYAKMGKLSIVVSTIQPVGKGLLHVQLEELKRKLLSEGLFDPAHKIAIPAFCNNICVVTSKTGAVIRDIVRTIRNKNNNINIYVMDVRVQGDTAPASIIDALKTADGMNFDCILLARGGGSFEDLFCFNDENLARAIYALNTPIISAVGHETDFTISDFVADSRAATPTAAAELAAYDVKQYSDYVKNKLSVMGKTVDFRLKSATEKLTGRFDALREKTLRLCAEGNKRLTVATGAVKAAADALFIRKEHLFTNVSTRLEGSNPLRLLKNGYFRAVTSQGKMIKGVSSLKVGDKLRLCAEDGIADCTVNTVDLAVNKERK